MELGCDDREIAVAVETSMIQRILLVRFLVLFYYALLLYGTSIANPARTFKKLCPKTRYDQIQSRGSLPPLCWEHLGRTLVDQFPAAKAAQITPRMPPDLTYIHEIGFLAIIIPIFKLCRSDFVILNSQLIQYLIHIPSSGKVNDSSVMGLLIIIIIVKLITNRDCDNYGKSCLFSS